MGASEIIFFETNYISALQAVFLEKATWLWKQRNPAKIWSTDILRQSYHSGKHEHASLNYIFRSLEKNVTWKVSSCEGFVRTSKNEVFFTIYVSTLFYLALERCGKNRPNVVNLTKKKAKWRRKEEVYVGQLLRDFQRISKILHDCVFWRFTSSKLVQIASHMSIETYHNQSACMRAVFKKFKIMSCQNTEYPAATLLIEKFFTI